MRLFHRPFEEKDREQLMQWLRDYMPAELMLPHGFDNPGESTETVVITREDERILLSLTATLLVGLDPLLSDPEARPEEIAPALDKAEAILTYRALQAGAVEAFIAIPDSLVAYQKFLMKRGYKPAFSNCVIFRKSLGHPTKPLPVDLPEVTEVP